MFRLIGGVGAYCFRISEHPNSKRGSETSSLAQSLFDMNRANRLSAEEAKAKAKCRELAMRAPKRDCQVMLYHVAESWERNAHALMDEESAA